MESQTDLYSILGVSKHATTEQIRQAYRAIARRTHPDKTPGDVEAHLLFRQASQAFEVLTDPMKRVLHDRGFAPISSVQDLFARNAAGRKLMELMLPTAPAAPQRGLDLVVTVQVPAEVIEQGGGVDLSIPSPTGEGRENLFLEIPPAAHRGPWCRLQRLGGQGRNGADHGDLLIITLAKGQG